MATLNREAIEQEIGKRFEKIEKTLERTLERTLEKAIGAAQEFQKSPAGARATAAAERASEKLSTAKKSLDEVLLGLEHKGYNVKEPQDLIQTVGRRVLERASTIANELADKAEDVRSQVAANPYSPEWLRDVKIPRAPVATESTAPDASGAGMKTGKSAPGAKSAKASSEAAVGATEGDATLAAQAAADGELGESLQDSKAERAAGTVVQGSTLGAKASTDVPSTSLAEASESDQAYEIAAAGVSADSSSKKSRKAAKTKK